MAQKLRLCTSNARGKSLIPDQGLTSQVLQGVAKKEKEYWESGVELGLQNASLRSRTVNQVYPWVSEKGCLWIGNNYGEVTASTQHSETLNHSLFPLGLKTGRIGHCREIDMAPKPILNQFWDQGLKALLSLCLYGISVPGGEVTRFFKVIFIGMTNLNIPGILWTSSFSLLGGIFGVDCPCLV